VPAHLRRPSVEAASFSIAQPLLQPLQHALALFHDAGGGPQRLLRGGPLLGQESRCAESVADVAAEALRRAVHLPQRAAALRAAVGGQLAQRLLPLDAGVAGGQQVLLHQSLGHRGRLRGRRAGVAGQQLGQLRHRGHPVHRCRGDGALRHLRVGGFSRILGEGQAAARLDRAQAGGAVVELAGQDHAHGAAAIGDRGGAEENVHRRPAAVLPRAVAQAVACGLHQQVAISRGNGDFAGSHRVALLGDAGRQLPGASEEAGQEAALAVAGVPHHRHRRRQVAGQVGYQLLQGGEAAAGGADDDEVAVLAGGAVEGGGFMGHGGAFQGWLAGCQLPRAGVRVGYQSVQGVCPGARRWRVRG